MKKSIFIIAIICSAILLNTGCLKEEAGTEKVVKANEFVNIMNNSTTSTDNTTKYEYFNLTMVDAGDTIVIKDKIHNLTYDSANNWTKVVFNTDLNHSLPVSGDLTQKFASGDTVKITFHVVTDVFADPNNPSWTVSVETLKEIWNTTTHRFTIIPNELVKKV